MTGFKMKVTPEIENLTEVCKEHSSLDLCPVRAVFPTGDMTSRS